MVRTRACKIGSHRRLKTINFVLRHFALSWFSQSRAVVNSKFPYSAMRCQHLNRNKLEILVNAWLMKITRGRWISKTVSLGGLRKLTSASGSPRLKQPNDMTSVPIDLFNCGRRLCVCVSSCQLIWIECAGAPAWLSWPITTLMQQRNVHANGYEYAIILRKNCSW